MTARDLVQHWRWTADCLPEKLDSVAATYRKCADRLERVLDGDAPSMTAARSEPKPKVRTKKDVLDARGTVNGCCGRQADNQSCSCLTDAVEDGPLTETDRRLLRLVEYKVARCGVCRDTGYTEPVRNGLNPNAKRCPNGCPVDCGICRNPNCDNPNGQH